MNMKGRWIFIVISACIFLNGCASAPSTRELNKREWQQTVAINTQKAYEDYIALHPIRTIKYTDYVNEAYRRLNQLQWDEALSKNTCKGYSDFLLLPKPRFFISDAVKRLNDNVMALVRSARTIYLEIGISGNAKNAINTTYFSDYIKKILQYADLTIVQDVNKSDLTLEIDIDLSDGKSKYSCVNCVEGTPDRFFYDNASARGRASLSAHDCVLSVFAQGKVNHELGKTDFPDLGYADQALTRSDFLEKILYLLNYARGPVFLKNLDKHSSSDLRAAADKAIQFKEDQLFLSREQNSFFCKGVNW